MVYYNRGKHITLDPSAAGLGEAPFALLLDVVKIALMKTSYSINVDTHEQFDDIASSEIVATSYPVRGEALASKAIAVDNTNDRAEFDAADLVYSGIGNGANDTFDQIVIMRELDTGPANATTELIAHATVNSTTTNGGDITLVFDAEGILHLT